jgi:hypothetical protein
VVVAQLDQKREVLVLLYVRSPLELQSLSEAQACACSVQYPCGVVKFSRCDSSPIESLLYWMRTCCRLSYIACLWGEHIAAVAGIRRLP